ncbi:hypothetical protein BDN72DRAFT_444114 [Pluteus cervinus]|uniref:Uncharacterized protein n=1 Tax=Pluteus cervinus TaxID=181527 RepID=A0ACD3BCI1_9AGAR|nr:hypothetical protein BDN72DRAFT_444114 [Pluteus cervinus]
MKSFQELTDVALGRDQAASSAAYTTIMRLIATDATNLHSAFALFRQNLDPTLIPTSLQNARTTTHLDTERALHAMKGLALAGLVYSKDERIIEGLCQVWNNVWGWLQYFHTSCIDEDRSPMQRRAAVFGAVCGVHKLYSSHARLRIVAESTWGYLEMITQQWMLQIRLSEFNTNPATYPPASALSAYTNPTGSVQPMATTRVASALGGNPDDIARLTLQHLTVTAEQARIEPKLAASPGGDIDLMANFRTSSAIRYALLSRHSVRTVTSVLYSLSLIPFSNEIRESVIFGITSCSHYLSYALESSNALPLIIEALEAQLLPALLRSGIWLSQMNPALVTGFLVPLTEILPKYLLYVSVLKVVARWLRRIRIQGVEAKVTQHGPLWDAWTEFKFLAEERFKIQSESNDPQDKFQVCYSSSCRKVDSNDMFMSCQGCHEVWFCSDSCQNASLPVHGRECRDIQVWRSQGRPPPMLPRDFQFSGLVAQIEVQNRSNEITSSFRAQRPRIPVVELDFTVFPFTLTAGSSTSLRPVDYETDKEERKNWDTMMSKAERESKAVLRYCVPEGEYRKVGMALLSMSR